MAKTLKSDLVLNCSHCGGVVPPKSSVYGRPNLIKQILDNQRKVFCSRGCSAAHAHANRTPEAREARRVTNRKTRGLQPKDCPVCGKPIWSKRKKFCSYTCWHTHKCTLSAEEKAAVTNKRLETYYSKSDKERAEIHARISASLLGMSPERRQSWLRKLKRPPEKCAKISERVVNWWNSLTPDERAVYTEKRVASWAAKSPEEKAAFSEKLSKAQSRITPEQRELISRATHETKKRNGTYRTNNSELYILLRLRSLFGPQVEYLYRDHPGYPFQADFYDPKSDTIFEFQGFFTHGGEPFDKNSKEHQRALKQLRARAGEWSADLTIKIWTQDDPKKRKTARLNKVTFVEWFSLKQFDVWYRGEIAKLFGASNFRDGLYKVGDKLLVAHDSRFLDKAVSKRAIVFYPWDNLQKVARMVAKRKPPMYARKTDCVVIERTTAEKFCDKFHLQGSCRGTKLAVGLRDKESGSIVGVMTFGKPRYNKNYQHELLRLCFSREVVGGSEKLWKFAMEHLGGGSVISYCDLSKFDGAVYSRLGFTRKRKAPPTKHWYNPVTNYRVTDNLLRQRGFDQLVGNKLGRPKGKGTSNEVLMRNHGFSEILDQGQAVFILNEIE